MTARELMAQIGQSPALLAMVLLAPSLAAIVLGWLHPPRGGGRTPFRYGYSLAVYVACAAGMGALVVDAYTLLFTRENLLDANLLVAAAPVAAMVSTLGLVGRNVDFKQLPGFDRLSGLMLMMGAAFIAVVFLSKAHFLVVFNGSVWQLLMLAAGVFVALKYGAHLMFRRRERSYE